jgi:4-hydroxy-2-oxoheptanedioate aldolase
MKTGPVFGPFSKIADPAVIEVLGHAGFDFVILDMEHGPNSPETLQNLIRAAEIAGIAPIVRVPEDDPGMISKVLDIGAAGVQVPQVTTAQAVREAVRVAKFSPQGERGVCRFVRAADYSSLNKQDYFKQANEAVLIIQLEGREALENLDEILSEPGIDVVFIGPYDLSQSLGVPGETMHPLVVEKTRQIAEACRARGIAVGNFTETVEQSRFWVEQGLRYMSFSVDVGLLYEACRQLNVELKIKGT